MRAGNSLSYTIVTSTIINQSVIAEAPCYLTKSWMIRLSKKLPKALTQKPIKIAAKINVFLFREDNIFCATIGQGMTCYFVDYR